MVILNPESLTDAQREVVRFIEQQIDEEHTERLRGGQQEDRQVIREATIQRKLKDAFPDHPRAARAIVYKIREARNIVATRESQAGYNIQKVPVTSPRSVPVMRRI